MTGLFYILNEDSVIIGMDSLVIQKNIETEEKTPWKFETKVLPLMHLKSVLCGVGNMDFFMKWFVEMNNCVIGCDIDILEKVARGKYEEFVKKIPCEFGATVYHFGYSIKEDRMKGFVLDTKKPHIEVIPYSQWAQPTAIMKNIEKVKEIKENCTIDGKTNGIKYAYEMLLEMKEIEDKKGDTSKIYIGGEMHFIGIEKQFQFHAFVVPFPDYLKQYNEILHQGQIELL